MDPCMRRVAWIAAALALLSGCETGAPEPGTSAAVSVKEPPGGEYVKASSLAPLPSFMPGLGTLYVRPKTLPAGPFQAYDRDGNLVSTLYMIPISDFDGHCRFDDLQSSPLPVTFVDIYYNAGHPGVPMPHYHIVLWHISRERALSLR